MPSVLGLILAGGNATRFGGGDKCLQHFQGRSLLAHIQERLAAQTDAQALSANGDAARFESFDLPVLSDPAEFKDAGPIAGLIGGLAHAQEKGFEFLLTVPGDAPLFPMSLASDLHSVLAGNDCARAESAGNPHPIFALWRTTCFEAVLAAATNRTRALWRVQRELSTVTLAYSTDPFDPFIDADTPEELSDLEQMVASLPIGRATRL